MKRNKKYNPNKVSNIISGKASQVHKLAMYYDNDVVDAISGEWLKNNPKEDVPTALLYPHIKGDLIIAIKHRLISMCQKWNIKMFFHIRNTKTGEHEDVEINFILPRSEMRDIKSGEADFKIDRGAGIKTRWKGLDREIEALLKPLEDEGFECIKTMVHIEVETSFKSKADYSYFLQEKKLRMLLREDMA
jgi:hypothetical protein